MSSDTPYIGSKIRLISKAKVRYEGYLYTIDPDKLTVTLAKVKTFGTENRAQEVVPPKNEIYEYVVFRGKDIDDLVVCETPQPYQQDPAIVQTGSATHNAAPTFDAPPQQQPQPQPPQQPVHPAPYSSVPPYFGYGPYGANPPTSSPYTMGYQPSAPAMPGQSPAAVIPPPGSEEQKNIAHGSFDATTKQPQSSFAAPGGPVKTNKPNESKPAVASNRTAPRKKSKEESKEQKPGENEKTHKSEAPRRTEGKKDHRAENSDGRSRNEYKDASEKRTRSRRSHDGTNGQKSLYTKTKSSFSEEFDFESSNAKFNKEEIEEELLKKLGKTLNIGHSNEGEDNDEDISNSPANKGALDANGLPSPDRCYDKTKSFFDNISCESDVKDNKFRSHERKLNVETFGVTSNSYRGRSYSRGRGRGGRGRGGWHGNRNQSGRGGWSNRDKNKTESNSNE